MTKKLSLLVLLLTLAASSVHAQSNNTTLIVYASTFIPFDSSFVAPESVGETSARFPSSFKRINRLKIDSTRTQCGTEGDGPAFEQFDHIYIGFVVHNRRNEDVTIDSLRYEIPNARGGRVRSSRIAPVSSTVIRAGKKAAVLFPFAEAHPSGKRRFIGHSRVPRRLEPRTVYYKITGRSKSESKILITHNHLIAFREVNSCNL